MVVAEGSRWAVADWAGGTWAFDRREPSCRPRVRGPSGREAGDGCVRLELGRRCEDAEHGSSGPGVVMSTRGPGRRARADCRGKTSPAGWWTRFRPRRSSLQDLGDDAERAQSNEDVVRRFIAACPSDAHRLAATTTIERLCADVLVDAERTGSRLA